MRREQKNRASGIAGFIALVLIIGFVVFAESRRPAELEAAERDWTFDQTYYDRDARTGLCFFVARNYNHAGTFLTFTLVPSGCGGK